MERSDWPEPNLVFKETVVRHILDHRVGTGPISNAEPVDVFEPEVVLRTYSFKVSSASVRDGKGSGRSQTWVRPMLME